MPSLTIRKAKEVKTADIIHGSFDNKEVRIFQLLQEKKSVNSNLFLVYL